MRINESIAIRTPALDLVPYCKHHVPIYHEWMQDQALREATASEPLTLAEEHAMQQSWRTDPDKLTFILVRHDPALPETDRMIGDVNLFLHADDSPDSDPDAEYLVAELEIMIARPLHRRKGHARAALLAFAAFLRDNVAAVLDEYAAANGARHREVAYLRAKIGVRNEGSVRLFRGLGFSFVSEVPDFFGEVEVRRSLDGVWAEVEEGRGEVVAYVVPEGVEGIATP